MAQQVITNLHKSMAELKDNSLVQGIRDTIGKISANIPDLMGRVDGTGHFHWRKIKKHFLKKLDKRRSRFRLALESLGWGTLADLLESALCGEKLNLWV